MIAIQEPHSDIFCAKGLEVVLREYHRAQSQEQAHKVAAREQKTAKNNSEILKKKKTSKFPNNKKKIKPFLSSEPNLVKTLCNSSQNRNAL